MTNILKLFSRKAGEPLDSLAVKSVRQHLSGDTQCGNTLTFFQPFLQTNLSSLPFPFSAIRCADPLYQRHQSLLSVRDMPYHITNKRGETRRMSVLNHKIIKQRFKLPVISATSN